MKNNKNLVLWISVICFVLLAFGIGIGYKLSKDNHKYNGVDEPVLGDTIVLEIGASKTLTPNRSNCGTMDENAGDCKFLWVSTVPGVASVTSSGVVRGVSAGTARITAMSHWNDGSEPDENAGSWDITVANIQTTKKCYCNTEQAFCDWRESAGSIYTVLHSGVSSASNCSALEKKCYCNSSQTTCSWTNSPSGYVIFLHSGISSQHACESLELTLQAEIVCSNFTADGTEKILAKCLDCSSMTGGQRDTGGTGKAVYATDAGSYTITGTGAEGYSDPSAVTCTVSQSSVTGVTINTDGTTTIDLGDYRIFRATVTPNTSPQTVTWSSNNTNVATVTNSGYVTPTGVGSAIITATSTADTTKKASVTVTVRNSNNPISYIKVGEAREKTYYLALPASDLEVGNKISASLKGYTEADSLLQGVTFSATRTSGTTAQFAINNNTNIIDFEATGSASQGNCPVVNIFKVNGTINGNTSSDATVTVNVYCKWTGPTTGKWYKEDVLKEVHPIGTRADMIYIEGCWAYEGDKDDDDGKGIYYTKRYNRCCGSSGGSSTPKEYCYANAQSISDATEARMLTKAEGNLTYKIPEVSASDCLPSACYGNGTTIENSTHADWYRTDKAPAGYTKLTIDNRNTCHAPVEGCYGNGPTIETSTDLQYKYDDSLVTYGYRRFPGVAATSCVKPTQPVSACYENLETGDYVWGDYSSQVGYKRLAISEDTKCIKDDPSAKCFYSSSGNYYYIDYNKMNDDDTLIEEVGNDASKCGNTPPHCYLFGSEYRWGEYSTTTGYTLVSSINDKILCTNEEPHCYQHNETGTYEWGRFAKNESYTLVSEIGEKDKCNNDIYVPQTAADVQTIIYIGVTILIVFGLTFMYYAFNNKKEA